MVLNIKQLQVVLVAPFLTAKQKPPKRGNYVILDLIEVLEGQQVIFSAPSAWNHARKVIRSRNFVPRAIYIKTFKKELIHILLVS